MKIQSPTQVALPPLVKAETPASTSDHVDPAPDAFQKQPKGDNDTAQMTKLAVTGLGGLALSIPCGYAGLAGGALVGAAFGGAVGPVASAFTSSGLGGAVSAAWHGAGTLGHIGLALGGATALVGAFATSAMVGRAAGRALGAQEESETKKPINWKNWANIGAGTVLLTGGIAAGVVGGLALGGGAGAAGQLVANVVQHGFSGAALSGIGGTALLVGAAAAPVAGYVGAKGGSALTQMLARRVIDPGTDAIKNLVTHQKEKKAALPTLGSANLTEQANQYHSRADGYGLATIFALPLVAPVVGTIVADVTSSGGWGLAAGVAVPVALMAASFHCTKKAEALEEMAQAK